MLGCARKFRSSPDELPVVLTRWKTRLAVLGERADIVALDARVAAARKQFEELGRRPVSYTHLDVYKRQTAYCAHLRLVT